MTPQWTRPTARLVIPPPAPRRAVPEPRYFSEPNASEPSWVRQQRLERSQGIRSNRNETVILAAFTAKCVSVADGDTLQVLQDGVAQNIRLNGIDAPELKQSFGIQAKNALSQLVLNQSLKIYPTKLDNNGRLWAWAFRGSLAVNAAQVEMGYAWSLEPKKSSPAKIATLENKARAAKVGLWSDKAPLAPWVWREKRTTKS